MKVAVWFSNGAASAVALKLAVDAFGAQNVRAVNNPVIEEDGDNLRFQKDVSDWCGIEIEQAVNPRFPDGSAVQVWWERRAMSFPHGAPCTVHLKKEARQHWENTNHVDWHVFGFTAEERKRHDSFVRSERENVLPILIDAGLTKQDCTDILLANGIAPPRIYSEGYPNANCIGCVKATSPTYWNLVRETRPKVFADRAAQSRALGVKLARHKGRRIFLDELPADAKGHPLKSLKMPECGIHCEEKGR
jgi:3'-phosphoadenosine 5'-phosphosulfate sulfotransferase (PAPS reductase)/FAD synthetase